MTPSNDEAASEFEKWHKKYWKTKNPYDDTYGYVKDAFLAGRASKIRFPDKVDIKLAEMAWDTERMSFNHPRDFLQGAMWCLNKIKALNDESGEK